VKRLHPRFWKYLEVSSCVLAAAFVSRDPASFGIVLYPAAGFLSLSAYWEISSAVCVCTTFHGIPGNPEQGRLERTPCVRISPVDAQRPRREGDE
jgi:hypothetical protein